MLYSFPSQNIPEANKDSSWMKQCIDAIITLGTVNEYERYQDLFCYNIYNGVWPKEMFDYLRKVEDYEFPAYIRHIPLQRPRIDLLIGQEIRRPLKNFRTYATNRDNIKVKEDMQLEMIMQTAYGVVAANQMQVNAMQQQIEQARQQLQQQQGQLDPATQSSLNAQIVNAMMQLQLQSMSTQQLANKINEELKAKELNNKRNFKMNIEIKSQKLLNNLIEAADVHSKFAEGFADSWITGKERYFVYAKDLNVPISLDKINPIRSAHSPEENARYIHQCQWFTWNVDMTISQIIDRFGPYWSAEELKALHESSSSLFDASINNTYQFSGLRQEQQFDMNDYGYRTLYSDLSRSNYQRTVHFTLWRSQRRINIKRSVKKDDPTVTFTHIIDDEEAAKTDKSLIQHKYVEDIYFGVRIAGNIYRCGKLPYVYRSVDNPGQAILPVFGHAYNSIIRRPYSVVWATKDLQILYNLVHYHEELMLATAGRRGMIMDKAQIPTDMSMDEWEYQKKVKGNMYINSAQYYNGMKPLFNQFQQYDESLSPSIQYLHVVKTKIEEMLGNAIGVPRQRLGALNPEDPVGTSKMSNVQSSLVTDYKFYEHDIIKKQVLTHMINLAWRTYKKGYYGMSILGAEGQELLNLKPEEMSLSDFDVFLTDSIHEANKFEELKQMAAVGLKTGNLNFRDVVKSYRYDTIPELESALDHMSKLNEEAAQANEERKLQIQQQIEQKREQMQQILQEQNRKIQELGLQLQDKNIQVTQQHYQQQDEIARMRLELDRQIQTGNLAVSKQDVDTERIMEAAYLEEEKRQADMEFAISQAELAMNKDTDEKKIKADLKKKSNTQQIGN